MNQSLFGGPKIRAVAIGAGVAALLSAGLWASNAVGADQNDQASAPEGFSTATEVKSSYASAEVAFGADFPNDVELPAMSNRIQKLADGAAGDAVFEEDYVESELITVWRCGWEQSLYDAVGDKDVAAHARASEQLAGYYDLETVKKWVDDPQHLWYKEVIEPALSGNLEPLADDLTNSCGDPFGP